MSHDNEDEFYVAVGKDAGRGRSARLKTDAPRALTARISDEEFKLLGSGAWAERDGVFWTTAKSHTTLPVGFYKMDMSPNVGPTFIAQSNDTDSLLEFPDSESQRVLNEIRMFKTLKEMFKQHGFLYKRGILLWGPPGSGKTTTLQLIVRELMQEHDSIAVQIDSPGVAAICLQALRRIEKERQIVAILEDLDALIENHGESEFLALLDGESQVDNIIYIATTNYPERLDKRFVDRPSRFDTISYIGMPNYECRRIYLAAKVPSLSEDDLDSYADKSEGYSIAHLRELVILTQCFGKSLLEATTRLNKSRQKIASDNSPDKPTFGFTERFRS